MPWPIRPEECPVPAVKPVAVRMVYQAAQAVKIPVIGMGGIMTADDALEFILAGATAVAVGTAQLREPLHNGRDRGWDRSVHEKVRSGRYQ